MPSRIALICRAMPSPPRWRPAPPESGTSAYSSTSSAYSFSSASAGRLEVLVRCTWIASIPSASHRAPMPPPMRLEIDETALAAAPWSGEDDRRDAVVRRGHGAIRRQQPGESAEQRPGDLVAGDTACAHRGGKPRIDQRSRFGADVDALEHAAVRQQIRIEQRLHRVVHRRTQRAFRHVERTARLCRGAREIHCESVAVHDHGRADRHRIAADPVIVEIRGELASPSAMSRMRLRSRRAV